MWFLIIIAISLCNKLEFSRWNNQITKINKFEKIFNKLITL